jgi:acetylornithine deacetylase
LPSTQGNEREAQLLVAGKLSEMNLTVEVWEPEGETLTAHPFFCSTRDRFNGSPNVVGVMQGSGGGRSIILNGHIDVVPAGDPGQWEGDPFSGEMKDGKLYGRGATDMKGGTVSLLLAIQAIRELNIRLKGDVIFQSVVEEESGGAGTLAAILQGYKADAALIPEPTNMRIFPKQQGSMPAIRFRFRSISGSLLEGIGLRRCRMPYNWRAEWEWPPKRKSSTRSRK